MVDKDAHQRETITKRPIWLALNENNWLNTFRHLLTNQILT